ncbi:MAG: DUF3823 domain-containing protein [Prevotella sp.]|jgi:hypothetical protein|nr:DUF3823 domain-containing protein [Prevotella sp.]
MKKLINYILIVLSSFFAASCEMDNYEGPDATIQGVIYDGISNTPLQVEHGSGIIRLREISWAKGDTLAYIGNQKLKVMQDGTYKNTKWFSGEYKMLPHSGPFFPYDDEYVDGDDAGELVTIKGVTTKDFIVIPFLSLEWVVKPTLLSDNRIHCVVRFKRNQKTGYEMPDVKEAWLQVSRVVNASARDLYMFPKSIVLTNNMENTDIEFISDVPVKYTGKSYFVRVVMNCQTAAGKPETNYQGIGSNNCTTVEEVIVP